MKPFSERMGSARGLVFGLAYELKNDNPELALQLLALGEAIEKSYFVPEAKWVRRSADEALASRIPEESTK